MVFLISSIIILIGLIRFDFFIYPTLDYFGKFVMVGSLNIVPFWIAWMIYNKYKNSNLKYLSIVWGIVSGGIFFILS
jgi:uncharacterized protein (DUF779 family)